MDKYYLIEGGGLVSYAIVSLAVYTCIDDIQAKAYIAGSNISVLIGYPALKLYLRKEDQKRQERRKKSRHYLDSDN